MAYGTLPTSSGLLDLPIQSYTPFAPGGITDVQRMGWLSQLQGLGAQMPAAQQYAAQMGGLAGAAPGMLSALTTNNPYAMETAQGARNVYGGYAGWTPNATSRFVQGTGASFDPMNQYLTGMVSEANKQLGREFNQSVMPQLNRAAVGAGPGAYGGTRAGVAQGIREQGLADAMQRQTTNMLGQGYEAGLGRYVQDRANSLGAINQALGTAQQGRLGALDIGTRLGQMQSQYGLEGLGMLPGIYNQAYQSGIIPGNLQGQFGGLLGNIGGAQQGANQNLSNWYNQQFGQVQQQPWTNAAQYASMISPYTSPGTMTQPYNPQVVPTGTSPLQGALGGAMAGYGLWNAYQNASNTPNTPTTGGGANPFDIYR